MKAIIEVSGKGTVFRTAASQAAELGLIERTEGNEVSVPYESVGILPPWSRKFHEAVFKALG